MDDFYATLWLFTQNPFPYDANLASWMNVESSPKKSQQKQIIITGVNKNWAHLIDMQEWMSPLNHRGANIQKNSYDKMFSRYPQHK